MKQFLSILFAWVVMSSSNEEAITQIYNGLLPWQRQNCTMYQVTSSCCKGIVYKIRYPQKESDVRKK